VTTLALPHAHREAVTAWPGKVLVDIDHLPSGQRIAARSAFADNEQPGIDTEVDHLRRIETGLLERADAVFVTHAHAARAVLSVVPGVSPVLVPPTHLGGSPRAQGRPGGHLVVPARFSDEWGTPDESALATLEELLEEMAAASEVSVAPEDAEPKMRQIARRVLTVVPRERSAAVTMSAVLAIDLRSYGVETFSRRFELSAAGVPWISSSVAVGCSSIDDARGVFGELATTFVLDDPDARGSAITTLTSEVELREEVAKVQFAALGGSRDTTGTELLAEVLAPLGIRSTTASPVLDRSGTPLRGLPHRRDSEYQRIPTEGTLAGADPRIEVLENQMVPLRLFDRDHSINLQSTLDADARYRVFAATHLEAPPANAPATGTQDLMVHFSVLVPTYNTDPELLDECIASVASQLHTGLELCIVDDGSTETAHHAVLRRWADCDDRIKVRFNPWNQGIALASNDALEMATGDWVVLLDHDDLLKPDALAWCARYIAECPEYEMWYSDEDKILPDGSLGMPFFKPDWSPDLVLGVNYVCHLLCVRRDLVAAVGGFRSEFDGAQDYDLVLRLTEQAARRGSPVGHIAKPLYSWRMIPGSTALDTSEKPEAHHAGHRALRDAMSRRMEPATVRDGEYDTTHRIRYSVDTSQLLTILIPTRDRVDLLARCVERIAESTHAVRYQLLVVDNDSSDPATLRYLEELEEDGHDVVRYPHEFSFARQINLGALHARGDLLLVLNNDTWPRNGDWLLRMMEHAQRPEVGLVGAKLVFPVGMRGDRPQHEGIVMGMAGLAYNIDLGGYMGMDQFVRNTSGVTAAAVMLRPSALAAVGGLEERLRVAYNDVDFSLRLGEYGYRIIYTPHAVLEHPESASRGTMHPENDEDYLVQRWGPKGAVREPFINPQLEWLMPVFYRL
jgi:glycosyltransferase involved in cell wall biosynthesis